MNDSPLFIPVLLGSIRDERVSDKAAAYVAKLLNERGIKSEVVDPKTYHRAESLEQQRPKPWSTIMQKADGLVIVTPEYNHGYPGALKEMLDSCYAEYAHKPVAICGCSMGPFGGARVVEQLRQVMIELSMVPMRNAVYFSNHNDLWNADGSIKDPSYAERIRPLLDELAWYAEALKNQRESKPFAGKK